MKAARSSSFSRRYMTGVKYSKKHSTAPYCEQLTSPISCRSASGVKSRSSLMAARAPGTVDSSAGSSSQAEHCSLDQAGQARQSDAHRSDIHVVLVEPQIPQNTGNIARTCAATNVALHLVGPLGFEIDDKKLKRAGLDYWDNVCVQLHKDWDSFFDHFQSLAAPKRLVGYSVYGDQYYGAPEFTYTAGDWLLFGAETTGLSMQAHNDIRSSGGSLVKIPVVDTYVRSLNQSVSVGVGVFEALRQLDIGNHRVQPREDTHNPMVRLPTPMMLQQQQQQQHQHQQHHQHKEPVKQFASSP